MTDWLRDIPVYSSVSQVARDMNRAVKADKDKYEQCERDTVLAGLVCYLAENYAPALLKEPILQIVDTYCGRPPEDTNAE